MKLERFICIHGHFYQPPREDPWTNRVEEQKGAHPYHDWNRRITAECYAPNASSPFDGKASLNNYSWISFNFGPTILSWLESHASATYDLILDADHESMKNFSGHGSAIAQAYNHLIMPLANSRDKRTQVIWGVEDFRKRFGRRPEGMWLPETAIDTDTLEALAESEIKFTILSPSQANAVRRIGEEAWSDVVGSKVNTRRAYSCNLPSGKKIQLFFFDKPISDAIAFKNILQSGETFAKRLVEDFSQNNEAQIVNVATDGEAYGHHHRGGDVALADCIQRINSANEVKMSNYGWFLDHFPPSHEVRIIERTSWSCSHGVERWRSNCGCASEIKPGWSQAWRTPLREAMDWLRDYLAKIFEQRGSELFRDPWEARNDSLEVFFDCTSGESHISFFAKHSLGNLTENDKALALRLLLMQRFALLMYTSCGWFWEDLARIETVQVIRYAIRAMEVAREVTGQDLKPEYRQRIERSLVNDKRFSTGGALFDLAASKRSVSGG